MTFLIFWKKYFVDFFDDFFVWLVGWVYDIHSLLGYSMQKSVFLQAVMISSNYSSCITIIFKQLYIFD